VVVLLLSKSLDVYEAISGVARRYGSWEIGELLVLFVVLPIPIGIFALRRWRELTSEIVEHGRTSEALAQSEERYRLVFENAREGISVHEVLPGGRWRLVDCNERVVEMAGRSRIELFKTGDLRGLRVEQPAPGGALPGNSEDGGSSTGVFSWLRPDGRENHVEYTTARLTRGHRKFDIVIDRDITARRRAEAELIHAERMSAVGMLAGGVAHEFNNIHGIVMGYLELILERDDLPGEVREDLRTVYDSTSRAVGVTNSLLTFVRKSKSAKRPVSLSSVVGDAVKLVEREYQTDGIEIDLQAGEAITLLADARQLVQVLLNLMINARHAMIGRPEQKLTVETGREGDRAAIRISDTGCGIPEEDVGKIFMPFYSTKGEHAAQDSAQSSVRGTGLGLSVCRRIIEGHGGEIEVRSRPGEGTTFSIRLPISEEQPPAAAEGAGPVKTVPGARVAILEDEPDMRALLSQLLEAMGYRASGFTSGAEALAGLRDEKTDLVLVDLQMPGMSGIDFIRALNELPEEGRPRVLVSTGRAQEPGDDERAELGIVDVIRKPFTNRALFESVYAALTAQGKAQT
jgi:PAS domain S-box-containing protein